ncbi:NitT/TauT family transport system ATP-binding protein [Marinobacter salarius]|jgi:NitT/TauT family transport system ATP-binding protein|uniref:NitT/TauT family transport system ATP-binding protein n=1 Tax=Marinobacter salarius TaxID=1420917 RepID=A0ABY1FPI9_9GAMM|nr:MULTISPECIES: ATP-binding cassette domain-containing protein [Marinobacter]KXJ45622.1 MAG: ABC transporter ATP-binding protein [Marinobacter sp. Hex_13]SFL79059.1 NitT/TauT family transport system ATP-binding protein [Marinobacter salarius]|tara:strand:+ start:6120 stop:6794 length:675 start_codon:yes stop_codon:yes gene_type:complete
MLELRIAGRSFGKPVLGEVFATIERGDHICLLGPSGIGKTTLLNAIAGLDKALPSDAIVGCDTLRIGYLFQEHRLLPWRTLNANLKLVGASDEEAEIVLGQVGLAGYGHYLPDQLSIGMARRAALARCLAVEPDLLLLDEPFASLDPVMAGELKTLIAGILGANASMAMICVTHDGRDAETLANRLWYLDGSPAQLQWDDAIGEPSLISDLLGKLRDSEGVDLV